MNSDAGLSSEDRLRRVIQLIDGYQSTCILIAAHRLQLFEKLDGPPIGIDALAAEIEAEPSALARLIRALCIYGLVEYVGTRIRLTEDGRLFNRGGVSDLTTLVSEQYLPAWGSLYRSVMTGHPAFNTVFGKTVWEHRR